MENAVVAGGFSGMDGHGLAVKLLDTCMGVWFCCQVARFCYQEFRFEVIRGIDDKVIACKNLLCVFEGKPQWIKVKFYCRVKGEESCCCRVDFPLSDCFRGMQNLALIIILISFIRLND